MGRKKRNQDKKKKEERKLAKLNSKDDSNKSLWFIVFCAIVVFAMFYLLTVYITNKNNPKKNNSEEEKTASVGETIIGRSFSMSNDPYLVLYYDTSDKDIASNCEFLFTNYRNANGEKSIYYVDMNSGFNKASATTEESNKNPQSTSELAINGPTLIKVQENKAVEYIEGLEAIEEYLK